MREILIFLFKNFPIDNIILFSGNVPEGHFNVFFIAIKDKTQFFLHFISTGVLN